MSDNVIVPWTLARRRGGIFEADSSTIVEMTGSVIRYMSHVGRESRLTFHASATVQYSATL